MGISLQPLTFGTVSATTSAAALNGGASLPCAGVCVECDPGASADVLVGDGSSQPLRLKPGQSLAMEITDAALLFVKSASGTQTVNWVAGPRDLRIFGTGLTGGGGGSPAAAVTIADGADTTFGARADAAAAGGSATAH